VMTAGSKYIFLSLEINTMTFFFMGKLTWKRKGKHLHSFSKRIWHHTGDLNLC
jgi:hypothetical protein